ncbi:hypothetical protein [Stenotrophomonas sp.]|uniref:hypothetical protein n=1 Tax=Stenotrophomonas sp. TaxID=69392 RepID=UPI002FC88747
METGSLLVGIVAAVMGLVWLVVPFVIFGIKDLLRELLAEQKKTNALLAHGPHAQPLDAPAPLPIEMARRYP